MELVDTHCHLTYANQELLPQILSNAARVGVKRFVCIGAGDGAASASGAVALAEEFPDVWASIGIHPHDAEKERSLEQLEKLAAHPKVVAVGETGLDYFRDWSPFDLQLALFRNTIAFAKNHRKPLIIHCRSAAADTLKVIREENAKEVGGVFHCYSEDAEFAKKLADENFLVSFTGNITFKKATELRETVKNIPLSQMMLETDMPYMAPEPFRGKESEPMHVYQVALKVSEVKGVSLDEVAACTTLNAERLFGICRK